MKVRLKHERLAQALAESPVTLNRWAQRMRLRSGHLSQLANGKRRYPTARTRQKLLDALDLAFDDLFEIETPAPAAPLEPTGFSEHGAAQPRPRQRDPGRHAGMSGWWLDLRFAVRGIRKRPGFAAAAVATLALGIGVNLMMFSVVNAVLLKALPQQDPEQLYVAHTVTDRRSRGNFSWPDYLGFQERLGGAMDLAVWDWEPFSLAGGDRPRRVGGGRVTSNFARVIGVDMLRGRFFTEAERLSDEAVLVIGEDLWRSTFAADDAIVGREIILDGRAATIVGVAPRHLDVIEDCQIFVPLRTSAEPEYRRFHWLAGHARLAPGVSEDQARERFRAVADELAARYPEYNEGRSADLLALRRARTGDSRQVLLLMLSVATAILLIVCANVANLLLARAAERRHEIGVRAALGADRLRLLRQLLTESGLLTLLGLGLGAALAVAGQRALVALAPPSTFPEWVDLGPDLGVVAFAVGIAAASMLLFAAVPALVQSRPLALTVRSGRGTSGGGWPVRRLLVVAQVAISFVLLIGSGLMLQSLARLMANESGFNTQGALVVGLDLLALRSEERPVREQRFLAYYRQLEAIPGVEAVGVIDRLALSGASNTVDVTVEAPGVEDYNPDVLLSTVTAGYFQAVGVPLLQGSDFQLEGTANEGQVVVSRRLAASFWPGEPAIGKRFKIGRPEDDEPWLEVRGVVGDVRHLGLEERPRPMAYTSSGAVGMTRAQWIVRADLDPAALTRALRSAVAAIDPNQPLWGIRSLEEHVDNASRGQRFLTTLLWLLAALAMILAAIGLYGVLAYAVDQRRHEFGVRLALGATRAQVARLVTGEGLRLVVIGLALGLLGFVALGRVLYGLLYGVDAMAPTVPALVMLLLVTVGLLAAILPARRAAAQDPVIALRGDG